MFRVLLIKQNPQDIAELFKAKGIELTTATSSAEALELCGITSRKSSKHLAEFGAIAVGLEASDYGVTFLGAVRSLYRGHLISCATNPFARCQQIAHGCQHFVGSKAALPCLTFSLLFKDERLLRGLQTSLEVISSRSWSGDSRPLVRQSA